MEDKIDFVITWVDGGDKDWQKERNKYAGKDPEDIADYRFRDWNLLKYWFRGVEKFAPWVNKVFFVTNGQKPEWLNLECDKLVWVKHKDYIPKEYLPTFSANPIELNFHRIEELSEKFVYFNDDTFLTSAVNIDDFFKNGLPRYYYQLDMNLNGDPIFEHIILNDSQIINKYLNLDDSFKKYRKKWYDNTHSFKQKIKNYFLSQFHKLPSMKVLHMPNPFLKSTLKELWNLCPNAFERTCQHKFRSTEDVNQYVFSWFDIVRGKSESFNPKYVKYFVLGSNDNEVYKSIVNSTYKMICLNDTCSVKNFDETKKFVVDTFERILPDKSSFEK